MILLIDNYDSFTYNLYQYLTELGASVSVARNDKITVDDIRSTRPDAIVISPGPKTPSEAGVSESVIKEFYKSVPILGVCLGHQAIGEVFGGKVTKAPIPMHGKTSQIIHNGKSIFTSLPIPFPATRYHSLVVSNKEVPEELEVIAWTEDDLIMGLKHRNYPTVGVQFHPESVMTENGKILLQNFLDGRI
ncbi:MAG: aminodeoxychorismate/anthranilate synthase component II [Bacteroidetes bacterium]|nr:aminodeoxychorismate/anthranilate synthase component II [Bacteroidota bacterium]MCL5268578.1 aminodeoxychorismate/anthranilate synthase component II [Bacteroidota bacterium]